MLTGLTAPDMLQHLDSFMTVPQRIVALLKALPAPALCLCCSHTVNGATLCRVMMQEPS